MWFAVLMWTGSARAGEAPALRDPEEPAAEAVSAAPSCAARAAASDLADALREAEQAFVDLDSAAFTAARARADALLPCLAVPLDAPAAARFHRVEAFAAYGEGQLGLAAGHLAAASVADPTYVFPPDVLPAGHPLRLMYDSATSRLGASEAVAPPKEGVIRLDGRDAAPRYPAAPVVAQWVAGDQVRFTALVAAGAPLPEYPKIPLDSGPHRVGRALRWTGIGMLGAGAVVGGVAFPIAASRRSAFLDADPAEMDRADLLALQRGTNRAATTAVIGGVTAAVGAGLLGASFAW